MTTNNQLKRNAFLKHGLLVMAMLTMLISASAQAPTTLLYKQPKVVSEDPNRRIYDVVEKLPSFPGGLEKFHKFLSRNIRYPAADREQNIQGKVMATFVVERNGSLSNIKILRSPTKGMRDEALRVLSLSPKWVPGQQNGKIVRAQYTMPITFTISGD